MRSSTTQLTRSRVCSLAMRIAGLAMAAVLCEAGVAMIVAILGALKAGRPFVPLNPRLPKCTLQEILGKLGPLFGLN